MSNLKRHIEKVSNTITEWLQPDNSELKKAIEKTVDEGLFSFEDIKHQIRVLKSTLQKKNLEIWADRSGLNLNSLNRKKVLCLHAGNLPLVGLQDLLAVILTGGDYYGKISKKDPYLLPTLLKKFVEVDLINGTQWSRELENFSGVRMNAVLFAGSESSAKEVKSSLKSLKIITKQTPALMRTAHFSIALIEDNESQTMEDLTEAVFRYGGTGCRSVAIVVAPFHLDSEKCEFTDYIESFWLKNPQHQKPEKSLFYRYAYNKALEIPQAWLNDFLIEENISYPKEKFVLYWVKGDFKTLSDLVDKYAYGLQSIYSTSEYIGQEVRGYHIEPLSTAQAPPIWWKPDQIDTIKWLQKKVAHQ
ncbi:MAG: acyl-CoA reductase [Balneolaceae bacterium]|nr:acyl-CoA reductase [Balneolaceae bacterium]